MAKDKDVLALRPAHSMLPWTRGGDSENGVSDFMVCTLVTYLLPILVARIVVNSVLSQKYVTYFLTFLVELFTVNAQPTVGPRGEDANSEQGNSDCTHGYVVGSAERTGSNRLLLSFVGEKRNRPCAQLVITEDAVRGEVEYDGRACSTELSGPLRLEHYSVPRLLAHQSSPILRKHTDSFSPCSSQVDEPTWRRLLWRFRVI